ncbi:MAG: hypothetical protein HUU20_14200 [Pirellulales bacterium]|nr:hypothetical protein [Pirellulales bacterium]
MMLRESAVVAMGFVVAGSTLAGIAGTAMAADGGEPLRTASAVVDFGPDLGQNFGTLFEAADASGRVRFGAGFLGVYNTVARSDRFTIQFYVRPVNDDNKFVFEPLPRYSEDTGVYTSEREGRLIAMARAYDFRVHTWDSAAHEWKVDPEFATLSLRDGDGRMRLGDGVLTFIQSKVDYNGKVILNPPKKGSYHHFYYAIGHLFWYHADPEQPTGVTVVACPWKPGQDAVDLSQAVAHQCPMGQTTWAYGQINGKVITVTNWGGVYVFDGKRWTSLRDPDGKSFQVYSALNYYDRVLLGQYPTGCVYEFDGHSISLKEGWPPRLPGVAAYSREAQTTTLYRGDLFVGVWPWAEIWRYDRDANRWHSMGRAFTSPAATDAVGHPYEKEILAYNEAKKASVVGNDWGQRVAGLVPIGDALMVSTSNKGGSKRVPEFTFIDQDTLNQYGRVSRLTLPGHLTAAIRWTGKPIELKFEIFTDRMRITQDGKQLACSSIEPSLTEGLKDAKVTWGRGVFGPATTTLKTTLTRPVPSGG